MKKQLAGFISLLLLVLLTLPALAAGSMTVTLRSSSATIRTGDSITITCSLKGSQKAGIVDMDVVYRADQLELITCVGISPAIREGELDIAKHTNGNTKNVQFLYMDSDGGATGIQSADAFRLTFKVIGKTINDSVNVSANVRTIGDGNAAAMAVTAKNVTLKIAAPLSANANLSSLTVSNASISPAFSTGTTVYSASVPFSTSNLVVSAQPEDSKARVAINSPTLAAGKTIAITATVTAENGAKKTYTIKVTREQNPNYQPSTNNKLTSLTVNPGILSPKFSPDVAAYVVWLPYEIDKITISGKAADSKAGVHVNGGDILKAGQDNNVSIICTAEDGTQKTYQIVVKRAAGDHAPPAPVDENQIQQDITDAGQKGGEQTVTVDLSANDTKRLPSSVFDTLADNPNTSLTLNIGDAKITFKGANVQKNALIISYDLSYQKDSAYQAVMSKDAGEDTSAFTYSFAHHGPLPGNAIFNIVTGYAAGQTVSVYRYNPDTRNYTIIAENITVAEGGIVSYTNNSCSDYVITTTRISNILKTNTPNQPEAPVNSYSLLVVVLISVAMLIIGIGAGFWLRILLSKNI